MSAPRLGWRGLLLPASWAYGAAVAACRIWRTRVLGARRVRIPVVSVGNITVGGTGKGPMVRWIARALAADGRHPLIALRGYRAGAMGSDEAIEHRTELPGVPVVVGADRAATIDRALAGDARIDAAILDDGFQHWALARDLDLVLVDATRPGLDEPMLPAGPRRESAAALRRADAVIVTRASSIDPGLGRRIGERHGRPPIAWCRHAWVSVGVVDRGVDWPSRRVEAVSWLAGRRVLLLAGVGNPAALLEQTRAVAPGVEWLRRLPDHAAFRADRLREWIDEASRRGAEAIVTTMKDWVKIAPLRGSLGDAPPIPFAVPVVEIEFLEGEAALRSRLRALRSLD